MSRIKTLLVALSLIIYIDNAASQNAQVLQKLERGIEEILDHLREQDRLDQPKEPETLRLLNMDSTLKRIEQQTVDIARQLRTATGRSGTATGEVQNLETRIESLEENIVTNVKGGVKKIEDVQRQADANKSEMEKRLGKMMNVMTQVHNDLRDKVLSKQETNRDEDDGQTNFMSEEIDDLKRKMQESLSVTSQTLTSAIQSLKAEILDPFMECKNLAEQVEDMKTKCESITIPDITNSESRDSHSWQASTNKEDLVRDITNTVMQNLTRVQREINNMMTQKLQDIENMILTDQPAKQQRSVTTEKTTTYPLPDPTTNPSTTQVTRATPTQASPSKSEKETADCKTLRYEVSRPHSCYELKQAGASCNGPYVIFPKGQTAVYAYCDMTSNGGGWTVLMRRGEYGSTPVNFDQNWEGYKVGFGDIQGEFWMGNENIRLLTSGQQTMTLTVILEAFDGNRTEIAYDQFWIESEENKYRLHLGDSSRSQAYFASSLRHHDGRAFTTYDQNNEDASKENCAIRYRGGWWYNRCHYALLTAQRFHKNQFRNKWQGIQWHAWRGNEVLKAAEMRIRPKIMN